MAARDRLLVSFTTAEKAHVLRAAFDRGLPLATFVRSAAVAAAGPLSKETERQRERSTSSSSQLPLPGEVPR